VPILVDSSVWIAAQNSRNSECLKLKRMIREGSDLAIIRAIQVEVTQGARTEELFQRLWEGFLGFKILEIEERHWLESALNYFNCRRAGLTVGTLDCLIATVARSNNAKLWTVDKQLRRVANTIGVGLF